MPLFGHSCLSCAHTHTHHTYIHHSHTHTYTGLVARANPQLPDGGGDVMGTSVLCNPQGRDAMLRTDACKYNTIDISLQAYDANTNHSSQKIHKEGGVC